MNYEKLKMIVEETVGNNDPFWINSAYKIVKKIISFPDGAEFSIYDFVSKVCKKIGISLTSKNKVLLQERYIIYN